MTRVPSKIRTPRIAVAAFAATAIEIEIRRALLNRINLSSRLTVCFSLVEAISDRGEDQKKQRVHRERADVRLGRAAPGADDAESELGEMVGREKRGDLLDRVRKKIDRHPLS